MGNRNGLVESPDKGLSVSRRGFVKATAALGAAAALAGCSKDSNSDIIYTGGGDTSVDIPETAPVERFYGASGHNCGGRCISIAEVQGGRIVRILTDENKFTSDGTYIDPESRNFPQTRSCSRCRSYKHRLYHPGRLLYPMKQTKTRGDLTGFKRISWEQAFKEITTKHKKVLDTYGVDGVYQIYACGSVSSQLNGAQSGPIGKSNGYAIKLMGGVQTTMFGSYSTHQNTYFGTNYTGVDGKELNSNELAEYTDTLILWGDNSMSTGNPSAYSSVRAVEDMKKRNPKANVIFIGPMFSDTGITIADRWVVSKPYTDPALIAGMIYHMLDNTFDLTTGALKANHWLDPDYLDTLVYGFFDSPAYSIDEATGVISAPDAIGNRDVPAVPAGKSYCSWLLGNNANAKTYEALGKASNYTASAFATLDVNFKRWAACSYEKASGSGTKYKTKQDFTTPKTPAWASAITGVPEATIKELAEIFAKGGPVCSRWSGGQQKQVDGIANLYAMQALHIVTKNVGKKGAGYVWIPFTGAVLDNDPAILSDFNSAQPNNIPVGTKPIASCTAWHTAIKMAFASELKTNGYDAKYIPNFAKGTDNTPNVYWDDGGTKAMISWRRYDVSDGALAGKIKTYSDDTGNTYYDWVGRTGLDGTANAHDGVPLIAGIRLMYNAGGNIFMNQHENSNDSRQMLECLKLNDYNDPHSFCLVSIDNFMSPTPRWSDYVLPATTFWEQQDVVSPTNGVPFYTQQVINPPGESKALFNIGEELVKHYANLIGDQAIVDAYYGGPSEPKTVEGIMRKRFETLKRAGTVPYSYMTWEEYKKNPILPAKPNNFKIEKHAREDIMKAYVALSDVTRMQPFIKGNTKVATNEYNAGGYGNEYADTSTAPKASLRFQLYSPVLTWQYVNKFSKFHGYLPAAKRGQQHRDLENDRIVLEIPVYYAYEDYFMEAYGGSDKIAELKFLLTTTHNRYRSHSSLAENPMLRELSHRVPGQTAKGGYKQGNDYNYYSMPANKSAAVNELSVIPELNRTIKADGTVDAANKEIASYSDIWINETDAASMGIKDGDLVQVENPVGAVRCVAKVTKRCAKGYVDLHQGCWYDPRTIDGKVVDVGGNCNTLMASQPSRIDHGNGQQSAFVKITKVNY